MTTLRSLTRDEWKPYFESLSGSVIGKRAEVEVASLDSGAQIVAERMPLLGISYDAENDLIDIALGGENQLNHLVRRPEQVELTEGSDGVTTIGITTADGGVQVLRLTDPLRLPASTV